MPDGSLVQYSVDRGIARIALDSPSNRNALSAALVGQLTDALAKANADEAVRAARIAPVSREMILNFVAQHSLGLPKSY